MYLGNFIVHCWSILNEFVVFVLCKYSTFLIACSIFNKEGVLGLRIIIWCTYILVCKGNRQWGLLDLHMKSVFSSRFVPTVQYNISRVEAAILGWVVLWSLSVISMLSF